MVECPDLAALVEQARALLKGVDPSDLKDDARLRRKIVTGFSQVKAALEPMVKELPGRKMRIGED